MSDFIDCPSCGRRLKLPSDLLGQDVRCPACDRTFRAAFEAEPLPAAKAAALETPAQRRPRFKHCEECGARVERDAVRCPECMVLLDADEEYPHDWEPHRGGLILTLGIMSALFGVLSICCGMPAVVGLALGIPTWIMAGHDLHEMRVGRMDRNGLANTQSGQSYAVVGVVLSFICGTGFVLVWLAIPTFR